MKTLAFLLAPALILAAPAAAAIADWSKAQHVTVAMTDHGFVPARLTLKAGAPYVLRVVNRSARGHDFSAKAFFKAARVEEADGAKVRDDKVDLDGRRSETPPTPGAIYEYRSTHLTDAASGLKGRIYVR